MPSALVFGASGQIGRFLVPCLLQLGWDITAPSRTERTSTRSGLHWVEGDLYTTMPALQRFDAIFSLGPLDAFSGWLERAEWQGRPRIVAFGSMSVVSKRDSVDPAERALAETLRLSEQRLRATCTAAGMVWTLLRPTLIYGAGIDRSLSPLAALGRRWRVFPRLAAADGLRQPVHAADLAEACLQVIASTHTEDRCYELGGGERIAFSLMIERVRASLGTPTLSIPVPFAAARAALAVLRLHPRWRGIHAGALARLQRDLVADNEAARTDFGWSPRAFRPDPTTWQAQPLP